MGPTVETDCGRSKHIILALEALDAGDLTLFVTTDGNAVGVSLRSCEIKSGSILKSTCGYGDDTLGALIDLWSQLTKLDGHKEYLVVNAGRDGRRAVRWNGAAWKTVTEPSKEQTT